MRRRHLIIMHDCMIAHPPSSQTALQAGFPASLSSRDRNHRFKSSTVLPERRRDRPSYLSQKRTYDTGESDRRRRGGCAVEGPLAGGGGDTAVDQGEPYLPDQ